MMVLLTDKKKVNQKQKIKERGKKRETRVDTFYE